MRDSVFGMNKVEVRMNGMSDELIIYPVSDVHRDTGLCDVDRWRGFLKKAEEEIKSGKNVLFLGVGDWNDFSAWGDRKKIRNASMHESTIARLDGAALRDCQQMVDELSFTKGHWGGIIQGNHRWDFTYAAGLAGKSSDDYYAEQLGAKMLGDAGYVRLIARYPNTRKTMTIDILLYHGRAGGKLAGSTINQIEDLTSVFPACDLYICGHDHRKVAVPLSTLWVDKACSQGMKLKQKRQWLIRSGSFLRGYMDGESSYIVSKMLRPTDLGIVKIKCKISRCLSGNEDGTRDDRCVSDIHVEY